MTTDTRADVRATQMVIGGESVDAADGQTFDVIDPATGKVIATAPLGGPEDVDRAVEAARRAFDDRKGWANWAAGKRGRSLAKLAALVKDHTEELAQLESRNVGKPITRRPRRDHRRQPRLRLLRRRRQQGLRPDDPGLASRGSTSPCASRSASSG